MISDTLPGTTETVGAEGLKEALIKGAEYLIRNHRILDNLNVFPVPDGDTGSNMVATLQAGIQTLSTSPISSMGDISRCMIDQLVRNSRGNSGFIIAWFFSGFFKAAERYEYFTKDCLLEGFTNGSYQVNTSLFTPVEGTMITIISAMTKALKECGSIDLRASLREALAAGRETLFNTPKMLPLLAKAGVVDSGALGFIFIMEGMLRGLARETIPQETEESYRFRPDPEALKEWTPLPEYRYCTEVYVSTTGDCDDQALHSFLQERGNSIALVKEQRFIKLHIHTNTPNEILDRLKPLGVIEKSKIEDMHEQVRLLAGTSAQEALCTVLSCVPGPGFKPIFDDLGIEHSLVFGRELPTAGDILEMLTEIEAENIILLPNNGNILPAAIMARDLCGKEVSIMPTKNIVQGIAAAYGYSETATMQENLQSMKDCIELAESLFVYRSSVCSVFGEVTIPAGHYFVISEDTVLITHEDIGMAVLGALDAAGADEKSNISLYTGEDFDERLLSPLRGKIEERYPALEFEVYSGGQPRELLIISVE